MFATLSDRLADTFKNLRGKGRLSEADIDATAREIRIALLEAEIQATLLQRHLHCRSACLRSPFGALTERPTAVGDTGDGCLE